MKARAMMDARTSFVLARLAVLSTTLTWHSHRIGPMDDRCFGGTTRYEGPPLLYGSSILCVCSCYANIAHVWAKFVQIELNYLGSAANVSSYPFITHTHTYTHKHT